MEILKEIKELIKVIESEADVYLFGSRARGDFQTDSDWDLLVLLPDFADYKTKNRISEQLYDLEIKYSVLFNIIYRKKNTWFNDKILKVTPFYQSVIKDYKRL